MLYRIAIAAYLTLGISASAFASSLSLSIRSPGSLLIRLPQILVLKLVSGSPRTVFFFKADWNPWFSPQAVQDALKPGILNLGIGVEHLYFNDRCRFTASLGSSTLLFDTALDEAWTTGFFIELSPVSLRWPLTEELTLQVEPTSISLAMPVLSGIPLVSFQYRHGISLEWKPK